MKAHAWAKIDKATGAALPLLDHGADVAAVLRRLLQSSAWSQRLSQAAGQMLAEQDQDRLCALAYLHDLGKANRGFWARQFEGARIVGHTNETAALFYTNLRERPEVCFLLETMKSWGCDEIFIAVMAHHGSPLKAYGRHGEDAQANSRKDIDHWRARDGYDPLAELAKLLDDVQARFPLAFEPGAPLPNQPAFVALVGGLVTLVDWLGSDATQFPVTGPYLLAREPWRAVSAVHAIEGRGLGPLETPCASFGEAFEGWVPQGAQAVADRLDLGPIALIEAETGSGKTEAALWRWLALRRAGLVDGLYFALPTRSAAVQLHGRVQKMLNRVFGDNAIEAVLAVPGYLRSGDVDGQALPGFEVVWPDNGVKDERWAAEHPKRYLSARVAVGTIDQVLMAGLQLRHAHFRATMLARSLLVVDEVHASDEFMGTVLRTVLRNHVAFGGQALLLSATLGAEARSRLLDLDRKMPAPTLAEAETVPYPAIGGSRLDPTLVSGAGRPQKQVQLELLPIIGEAEAIARRAIAAADAGASVLVVRNSVAGAVAVARAVEKIEPALVFKVAGVGTLHHGRFAPLDRRLLDAAVESAFGKGRCPKGRILVGTQTLEQSLDIDADLLLTDLAPVDVLLQRIGRLHRHDRQGRGAFAEARALILVPSDRDLTRYLGRVGDRHGLGPLRSGEGVYPDLLILEATLRLIEANPEIYIPADNRRLVENALHTEVTGALAVELGPKWINHGAQQDGIAISERDLARRLSLDVTSPFSTLLFPDKDEAIATRLGTRDRLVEFDPPLRGPFGRVVSRLTIPGWMCGGVPVDATPTDILDDGEAVSFVLGDRRYAYGRFGLNQA